MYLPTQLIFFAHRSLFVHFFSSFLSWQLPLSLIFSTFAFFMDVRRFLGFTNFSRRIIEDYSAMSRPLERLTGKQTKFTWSAEQQEGFDKLRQALLKAPVLMIADVHRPFRVVSDASDTAIGAVLLQEDAAGEWHPVAYTSRRSRPEESNYTKMERETFAAIHPLRVWRLYLRPVQPFRVGHGQSRYIWISGRYIWILRRTWRSERLGG